MPRPAGPYAWLNDEPGPRMLTEALKLYGVLEGPGAANNPTIVGWADELAAALPTAYARWAGTWYAEDATPWCGLFMAVVAQRANVDDRPERRPPEKYLSAASWAGWGLDAEALGGAELGDVLVFTRQGGGHVGLYVGEDATHYHVLGGNQGDRVNISRIAKDRLTAVSRPRYLAKPANVRKVRLSPVGEISRNEA